MTAPIDQDYFGGKPLSECSRIITRHAHICSRYPKDSEEFHTLLDLQEVAQDMLTYIRKAKDARINAARSRPRGRPKQQPQK